MLFSLLWIVQRSKNFPQILLCFGSSEKMLHYLLPVDSAEVCYKGSLAGRVAVSRCRLDGGDVDKLPPAYLTKHKMVIFRI